MSYRTFIPLLLLVVSCGRKSSSPVADAVPAPQGAEAVAAVPEPSGTDAGGGETGTDSGVAAERPCELRWTVASAPDRTLLDGALAGGVAALLYGVGEGFVLLMAAGDPPEMLAVSLPGWPDPSGPAEGSPAGAVASYGDRFLVAYGPAGPERVVLRLRAVTAVRGRLIPVNAPGAPGSDGAPVLELPAPTPEARPTVLLHAYSRGVVLGAGFLEAEPAVGTAVVRTPTGAPAAEDVFAWRLAVESGGPGGGRWRLESPAGPELVRYVGPLGGTALGMTAAGTPVLVPAPPRRAPFAFADGWVPAPGEAIRFGNERLVREEPRAGGGLLAVVYDVRGRVTARLALPSGTRPLAVSRAPDELLVLGPDGEPGLCIADQPPRLPTRLDPRGVLASPTTGSGSCGR